MVVKPRTVKKPRKPEAQRRIDKALELAYQYGGIDGGHHKMWTIDQIVRTLTGRRYNTWVKKFNAGEDGQDTYSWDEGIAP